MVFLLKISQIRSFEHIIVRIIGFNQAELFLGFLEHHPISSFRSSPYTQIKVAFWWTVQTIHKLCNIKLENPKNAIPFPPPPCTSSKKLMSSSRNCSP